MTIFSAADAVTRRASKMAALACGVSALLLAPQPGFAQTAPIAQAAETQAAQPSVTQRYARADDYLYDGMRDLVIDANMGAQFTQGARGVLFRKGPGNAREILFHDLNDQRTTPVIAESAIADLLSQATGEKVEPWAVPLRDAAYDPATGNLDFNAFNRRWRIARDHTMRAIESQNPKAQEGLSPDGRFRIVARNFNLVAIDVQNGREVALTTDGTREQPYGRDIPMLPQILAAGTEEPDMPVSLRWSPDSRKIITWRDDVREVRRLSVTQENPPGEFYPRSFSYVYPLAGAEKLPQATRVIIDVEAALRRGRARIVPVDVPSESLLYPASPDMGWYENGDARVQWTERGYGKLVVYRVDPETGAAREVAVEQVKPLVTVTSSYIMPAPKVMGGELSLSERTGWAQLYLVKPEDPSGGIALTHGEWEVIGVDHVSEDGNRILITGVGREPDRNPYWRQLYRVSRSEGTTTLLTPEPLDHDVSVSPDGKYFIDAMSSPTQATRTVIRDAETGAILSELGRADASKLLATGYTLPEPFRGVAADGHTPLYAMIYRPANFDPSRSYPVIDHVYTGPTTTQVPTSWGGTIFSASSSVAQLGAVVVMIDGTGTSRRGQAFRLPAYRNLGEVGLDDHIAMIRQMAARYPYLDTDRVGVFGGSAGGYDAARFILRRPNFFKVAVASSGNHDLRLDKAWWPEVSMGYAPQPIWEANSNMSVAANLQGHLLLIHGDIDDNVPVTESYRLAQALIEAKRDVDLVILPNTRHAVYQPFFWRKFRDYFTRNLIGDTPPALPLSAAAASGPLPGAPAPENDPEADPDTDTTKTTDE